MTASIPPTMTTGAALGQLFTDLIKSGIPGDTAQTIVINAAHAVISNDGGFSVSEPVDRSVAA